MPAACQSVNQRNLAVLRALQKPSPPPILKDVPYPVSVCRLFRVSRVETESPRPRSHCPRDYGPRSSRRNRPANDPRRFCSATVTRTTIPVKVKSWFSSILCLSGARYLPHTEKENSRVLETARGKRRSVGIFSFRSNSIFASSDKSTIVPYQNSRRIVVERNLCPEESSRAQSEYLSRYLYRGNAPFGIDLTIASRLLQLSRSAVSSHRSRFRRRVKTSGNRSEGCIGSKRRPLSRTDATSRKVGNVNDRPSTVSFDGIVEFRSAL